MTEAEYVWLRDYLDDPDLLRLPEPIIPYLAWPGRMTLLAGREKSGKTTLVKEGVARSSTGRSFLDEPTQLATTLLLGLDEPLADTVRSLVAFGADPSRVAIRSIRPHDDKHLTTLIEDTGATVVVIDALTDFLAGLITKGGEAAQWTPHLAALRSVARATGAGIVILHHATKAGTGYRDSGEIGAKVDVIAEFQPFERGETRRKIAVTARFPVRDFELDFAEGVYSLAGSSDLAREAASSDQRSEAATNLLQLLADSEPDGLTSSSWWKLAEIPKTTYHRLRRGLIRAGYVLDPSATRTARYRISDHGEGHLARKVPGCHEVPSGASGTPGTSATGTKGQSMSLVPGGTDQMEHSIPQVVAS